MNIQIAAGTGAGPTKLSAYDAALDATGLANYNLIRLSSIVPPKSIIEVRDRGVIKQPGEWGDKLYVVIADTRVDTPNTEAWSGIGWVQDKRTGKGLFVEHEGHSEATVKRDIEQSLGAMMATRKVDYGPISMKIIGKTCFHEPVCALVIAAYHATGWRTSLRKVPGLHKL